MNKNEALQLWDELYLSESKAYDYASHPMKREDYNNENSIYGWTIDVKQPNKTAGKNLINNEIPSSIVTKTIREGKTSFKVGKFLFEVRKSKEVYGEYDIYDITNSSNPINMEPSDENQEEEYNTNRRKDILDSKKLLNDQDIDEELKVQRLKEKVEKEGYLPSEEEKSKLYSTKELKEIKEEVEDSVLNNTADNKEDNLILQDNKLNDKESTSNKEKLNQEETISENINPIKEDVKEKEETKEIIDVKEDKVEKVINSLKYELAPMFPVVNILE